MATNSWMARLLWLEPLWIGAIGLLIILPTPIPSSRWFPLLVIAMFAFWPLRWCSIWRERRAQAAGQGDPRPSLIYLGSPLSLSLLTMLGWLPVNLWASADRMTAWIAVSYLLLGVAFFVALLHWPPVQTHVDAMAALLILTGTALAATAPLATSWKAQERLFQTPLYGMLESIPINLGETIHANVLAGGLVLILPLGVAMSLRKRVHRGAERGLFARLAALPRIIYALPTGLMLIVLALTQSRGGYLALSAGLFVYAVTRWRRLLWLTPLLLFAIAGLVWQTGTSVILDQLSADGALGGWPGRMEIWSQSWQALNDFPFTGIGIGSFTQVLPTLYPLRVAIEDFPHAHNIFLQIGLDLGIPGLVAYLAFLIGLFTLLGLSLRQLAIDQQASNDEASGAQQIVQPDLIGGALGGLVAMLVHGLLDVTLWGNRLAFVPWLLFALIALIHQTTFESPSPVEIDRNLAPKETSSSATSGI